MEGLEEQGGEDGGEQEQRGRIGGEVGQEGLFLQRK